MQSEQYAAQRPRRPSLARAGSALAPALVLCAVAGVAGQAHRFYGVYQGAFFLTAPGQSDVPPLSLRIGYLLSDPSTTAPAMAPALSVLALAGLHLLRVRVAPVRDPVRRLGAAAAGLVGAVGLALTVVVVVWVTVTHGSVGSSDGSAAGTGTFDASVQLDPWDTLLGQGSVALLAAVIGAGAALLLLTRPSVPVSAERAGAVPDAGAAAAGAGTPAGSGASPAASPREEPGSAASTTPTSPTTRSTRSTRSTPSPDEGVVLASPPEVDLAAFRRPDPRGGTGARGGAAEGYRRPTERSGDSV